jgi:hypothetical protein
MLLRVCMASPRLIGLQHLHRRLSRRRCFFSQARLTNIAAHEAVIRSRRIHDRLLPRVCACLLVVLMFVPSASAQYVFDPNNADEKSGGIKYFGSAKDDQGALLPGVTILIGRELVLVTDGQGRYRGSVDPMYTADETIECSKRGYQFVRVLKRPGPVGAARQTVEANCILHKIQ